VLIVAVGAMAATALDVADRLAAQEIGATVVDPRWVKPVPDEVVGMADRYRLVVTIEDNGVVGGVGAAVAGRLREAGCRTAVRTIGIPQRFLDHGSRSQVLAEVGLTAQQIGHEVIGWISADSATLDLGARVDESSN